MMILRMIPGKKLFKCRLILVINPSNKWYNGKIRRHLDSIKYVYIRNFRNSKCRLR